MKKTASFPFALCVIVGILASNVLAQTGSQELIAKPQAQTNAVGPNPDKRSSALEDDATSEVELLRKRVDEIERQNRELLKTLSEMNAKLDALSHPEVASNAASPAAAAPP